MCVYYMCLLYIYVTCNKYVCVFTKSKSKVCFFPKMICFILVIFLSYESFTKLILVFSFVAVLYAIPICPPSHQGPLEVILLFISLATFSHLLFHPLSVRYEHFPHPHNRWKCKDSLF